MMKPIKICRHGNKVLAVMGKYIGIARCHPSDRFDIYTGAKLAVERLEEHIDWPKPGVKCFLVDITKTNLYRMVTYTESCKSWKKRNLLFKTKEEAVERANELLEVLRSDS